MRSIGIRAALVAVALLVLASPALAQSNSVVAVKPSRALVYTSLGYDVFDTVQEAVVAAVNRANAAYQHYTVMVDYNGGAAWLESVDVYADADITIRGVHGPVSSIPDPPQDIIIESPATTLPAIGVIAAMYGTNAVNRLEIEGLTVTGGDSGIQIGYGAAPKLSRIYARDNAGSGILCEDGANVRLVNCSIVNNARDGVEVGQDSFADILFCTIAFNGRCGIRVFSDINANASVANTIVFQNTQTGLEWSTVSTPVLDTNDVYGNSPDYMRVTPTNDLSIDPELWDFHWTDVSTPWVGALAASRAVYCSYTEYASAVVDAASAAYGVYEDFTRELRPVKYFPTSPGDLPDIGADEVNCGIVFGDVPVWIGCVVTPDPVGRKEPGDVQIDITFNNPAVNPVLFVVPEGGDVLDPADYIEFSYQTSPAINTYRFTNVDPIDPAQFDTVDPPNIIDGHAIVYVTVDTYTYGAPDMSLIAGQALIGRHFLIDTTPPRMMAGAGLSAADLVDVLNASLPNWTANTGVLTANHPALPAFPAGYLPATTPAPTDGGLISQGIFAGPGAQVFVNATSISNNLPLENLDIMVTVPFEDLPPEGTTRTVSGFFASNTEDTVGSPSNGVAQWVFDTGATLFANLQQAHCEYTTSGTNMGFDPANPGGPDDMSYDYNNSTTSAEWTFVDNNGLDGLRPDKAPVHSSVRFRAIDRAGNMTAINELLEPLQIWWLIEALSRIQPNQEGQTISGVNFTVHMDRTLNPVGIAGTTLEPQYTYRFYTSSLYEGPYTAATPWGGWQDMSLNQITSASSFGGQWVLMVTLVADEAGNVEWWPVEDIDTIDNPQDFLFPNGVNWQRFRIGIGGLDTAITPTFWHDRFSDTAGTLDTGEATFGAQTIIPSPADLEFRYVAARFNVTALADIASPTLKVAWQITRGDGQLVTRGVTVPDASGNVTVVVPFETTLGVPIILPTADPTTDPIPPFILHNAQLTDTRSLEDRNPVAQARRARNWVFSAATFLDSSNDDLWNTGEDGDPTPASFAFTVVPQTSLEDYVRNRESMDRQPIKVQEER